MTSDIEPHIKKYIDATVGSAVGIATEEFQHRLTLMGELFEARTRSFIDEKFDLKFDQKFDQKFDEKFTPFLRRMDIWAAEMKALRCEVNVHDKRITKLEHMRA